MAPTIRVDDEVYAWLQGQARPFEDTPNSVLRRVASLDASRQAMASKSSGVTGALPTVLRVESTMTTRKFDEFDRQKTIEAVEQHFGVKLSRIRSRKKYLQDESRNPYLVLGGYDDWHGVPEEIVADTRNKLPDAKLIIAKRSGMRTKIYWAPLKTLLQGTDRLRVNQEGDRQFNLDKSDPPCIKEAPDVQLELLAEIEYPEEAREK